MVDIASIAEGLGKAVEGMGEGLSSVEKLAEASEKFAENATEFPGEGLFGGKPDFEGLSKVVDEHLMEETKGALEKLDGEILVAKDTFLDDLEKIERGENPFPMSWLGGEPSSAVKNGIEGPPGFFDHYTPDEMTKVNTLSRDMYQEAQDRFVGEFDEESFDSLMGELENSPELEQDRELEKLILRVAIKVGTKSAASLAKQISKDPKNSRATRYTAGVFADLVGDGGKFAERLITGEKNPDLVGDIISFFNS